MEVNFSERKVAATELPIEQLAKNTHLTDAERIAGVSRHFEAILLRQFLSEAQKPVLDPKGGLHGAANEIYKDMMVNVLAEQISKTGTLGIAQSFQSQLSPHQKKQAAAGKEILASE